MARVWLAGPEDSVTAALAERLDECVVSSAAAPAPGGAEVAVYRPSLRGEPPDLDEVERFCREAGHLPRVVVLSSALVHAPHHHNPGYVAESYRSQGSNPVAEAWRAFEVRCAARLPDAQRIVLRPAAVAARDGKDFLGRPLSARTAVVPPRSAGSIAAAGAPICGTTGPWYARSAARCGPVWRRPCGRCWRGGSRSSAARFLKRKLTPVLG